MVLTYFSCNLSAITNSALINISLNFNDGNTFNYNINDSYLLIPKYYSQTNMYNISALVTSPSLNIGVYNVINGRLNTLSP